MLLVEGSSETVIFRYLFNNVFRSPNVQKYISYEGRLFFLKRVKSESSLSLLRREYLSSAVNVLTKYPKILLLPERDFFQLTCFHSDQ